MCFTCVMRLFFIGLVSKSFKKIKEKEATKNHLLERVLILFIFLAFLYDVIVLH